MLKLGKRCEEDQYGQYVKAMCFILDYVQWYGLHLQLFGQHLTFFNKSKKCLLKQYAETQMFWYASVWVKIYMPRQIKQGNFSWPQTIVMPKIQLKMNNFSKISNRIWLILGEKGNFWTFWKLHSGYAEVAEALFSVLKDQLFGLFSDWKSLRESV